MNAQRWIALALLSIVIIALGTNSLWLPLIKREKAAAPTAAPQFVAPAATPASTSTAAAVLRGTATIAPTTNPVIATLMAETGLKALGVGDKPAIILSGEFTTIDELHSAVGTASVWRLGASKRAVRLDPFTVTSGPDIHVILSQNEVPRTSSDALLPTHIDLGPLKTFDGPQNFDIPDSANLDQYHSVVVYSTSLSLVFSSAPLRQVRG